ncbi:MAG: response regulator transcription factor [Caldilineaceae bacterium]|nr:response regulator transcription factor [Caldilineaceae bacterium]
MAEARILVADDEPKMVHLVTEVLTASGFAVLSTALGREAIEMVAVEQPDLLILDIGLAGKMDGFEVAQRVREFSNIPIIMLTAKARESDLLQGFDAGTDDYLTKPFGARELLARIRALLNRSRLESVTPSQASIQCGPLRIDLARRRVTMDGQLASLTRTEYNLLHELATHPNRVMLHEELLTRVWGVEYRNDLDYLRAYVRYLRRKLEPDPANPQLIITQVGVGYMLVCQEEHT